MKNLAVTCSINLVTLSVLMLLEPVKAVTIDLLPDTQNVTVGQPISIDVQISELGNGTPPSVGGFNLELNYAPTVLSFNDLTFSGLINLSGLGIQSIDSSTPGTLSFGEVTLDLPADLNTAQPDSFSLANIEFMGSGIGTNSPLTLTIIELVDENFTELEPVTKNDAIVTVSSAATQVPEFGLGLKGWGILLGFSWVMTQKK